MLVWVCPFLLLGYDRENTALCPLVLQNGGLFMLLPARFDGFFTTFWLSLGKWVQVLHGWFRAQLLCSAATPLAELFSSFHDCILLALVFC